MFDVLPKALASVASFLFPLFASYKALNTADPAELAPWLMYWVVLSCVVLVEAWTEWILVWVPFYHYFRLFFLLYLVLPQTQGARLLYLTYLHPWLEEHETRIDEFIGTAHERLKTESLVYLRKAIAYLRTQVLGLPPTEAEAAAAAAAASSQSVPASSAYPYTQSLLARFSLPSARWPGGVDSASASGVLPPRGGPSGSANSGDYYALLAKTLNALGTATGAAGGAAASAFSGATAAVASSSAYAATSDNGNLPQGQTATYAERASFIATQRDRLRLLLSALDQEAAQLEEEGHGQQHSVAGDATPTSVWGTAADAFEKIDAESGAEDDNVPVRQRRRRTPTSTASAAAGGSWSSWIWGSGGEAAQTSGADTATPGK